MHLLRLYSAVARTGMDPITATHSSELPQFVTIRVPKSTETKHLPTHVLTVYACKGIPVPASIAQSDRIVRTLDHSRRTARASQHFLTPRLQ